MDIRGKFFPVGLGLTYAFKISDVIGVNDVHLLYDINRKCDMKELEIFYGNKEIDYLILSHLHADHVNGVDKLCKAGFRVRKIYIPYLNDDERIFVELKWLFKTGNYQSYTRIVDRLREILENVDVIEVGVEWGDGQISFTVGKKLWQFNIFQNKGNSAAAMNDIKTRLQRMGISNNTSIQNVNIKDLRKAYNKSMGKHNFKLNETSIFLEHGPLMKQIKIIGINGYDFFTGTNGNMFEIGTHSLITGDMNLNEKRNERVVSNYYNILGVVLVPHHSGVHEWSAYVCQNMHYAVWVVGISGIGVRPYGKVVKDIYGNGQKLYICDKNYSFEYVYG